MGTRIVVIGGVATGPKAAARARRRDPEADITIVEKGDLLSYAGCGMPFYIGGQVKDAEDLMRTPVGVLRDVAFFKNVKNVNVLTRTLVQRIDRSTRQLSVVNLESGEEAVLPYDKLVLATGGSPIVPPIDGLTLAGVFRLGHPNDAVAIRDTIATGKVKKVAIIGGGLIGLELSEAIMRQGLQVAILEMRDQLLPGLLDDDTAALVANHLRAKGVDLRLGSPVVELVGDADQQFVGAQTKAGLVGADMAIVAIGVRPNIKLAIDAGLEIGATGAIKVNECLQTSDPNIYAGGDCVESRHLVTGAPVYAPMGSTANKHGRVIGDNITGGFEHFPGVAGTAVLKVMDYNIARTGLTAAAARDAGFEVVTSLVPSPDCAHYHPDHRDVVVKLVVDAESWRVLGAQAVGAGEAVKRVDVVATAISFGATVQQLSSIDLGYAPPFSTAIDVVAHAANVCRNKLEGIAASVPACDVKQKMLDGEDFVLLDVRSPREYAEIRIDDAHVKQLSLGKLRERLGELPRDKEIIAFCKVSLRGYEAAVTLKGAGFQSVKFMDGGVEAWPYGTKNGE